MANSHPPLNEVRNQSERAKFSTPLENSTPLEAPRHGYIAAMSQPSAVLEAQVATQDSTKIISHEPEIAPFNDAIGALVVDKITVPLIAERLIVDRRRRKVGEVVVRKEIETCMVEVPIRRERLIVEQISPDYQQLAVVDLGQPVDKIALSAAMSSATVNAKFTSASAAIEFIKTIAAGSRSGLAAMQVSIILEDESLQAAYRHWLESSASPANSAQSL